MPVLAVISLFCRLQACNACVLLQNIAPRRLGLGTAGLLVPWVVPHHYAHTVNFRHVLMCTEGSVHPVAAVLLLCCLQPVAYSHPLLIVGCEMHPVAYRHLLCIVVRGMSTASVQYSLLRRGKECSTRQGLRLGNHTVLGPVGVNSVLVVKVSPHNVPPGCAHACFVRNGANGACLLFCQSHWAVASLHPMD